jgi:hypothetical protein
MNPPRLHIAFLNAFLVSKFHSAHSFMTMGFAALRRNFDILVDSRCMRDDGVVAMHNYLTNCNSSAARKGEQELLLVYVDSALTSDQAWEKLMIPAVVVDSLRHALSLKETNINLLIMRTDGTCACMNQTALGHFQYYDARLPLNKVRTGSFRSFDNLAHYFRYFHSLYTTEASKATRIPGCVGLEELSEAEYDLLLASPFSPHAY